MERVIPFEDEDISDFVDNSLRKNGVQIFHSAKLRDIIRHRNYLEVVLDFDEGHSEVVEVDTVFVSVGRMPNLSTLNLDKVGIETTPKGYLVTNESCCVKDNIFAAGDVTQHPNLVNVAEMEGRFAVKHMFGVSQKPLNYSNMSTIMFFYPAVAAVGLNEKKCQELKIPYLAAHYSNSLLNRAIAMRNTDGFVKIIASDDEDQRILGMRAAGAQVSGTIMSIALMMEQDKKMGDVLKSLYPHPTMSEAIQEGMRLLLNKSVYKCQAFPEQLKLWSWHPEKGFEIGPKPTACIV